jgi:hypothetical protein
VFESLTAEVDTSKNMFVSALADIINTAFPTSSLVSYMASSGAATNSYITVNITSNNVTLTRPGYCFDKNNFITLGTNYSNCKLYSTLRNDLPVVHSENVNLVNYIMNQVYTGATAQDKQDAIWNLLQDIATVNTKALSIIADAKQNGKNFFPTTEQSVGLMVYCGATIQPNTGFFKFSDLFLGSGVARMLGNTNYCQYGSYLSMKFN